MGMEGAIEAKRENNRWKPRRYSPVTVGLLIFGVVLLLVWLAAVAQTAVTSPDDTTTALLEKWSLDGFIQIVATLAEPFNTVVEILITWALPSGIVCVLASIISEVISRRRKPPATWRVRDELTRALCDLGLLDVDHRDRWQGVFWVAPKGKYHRKTKRYELVFTLRSAKASEHVFDDIGDRVAVFRGCEDATIEPWRLRGNREGFKLALWYTVNPYKKAVDSLSPW